MRFEIKSGGVAAILVGIAALSGAVFMLGLLAGYDVGRESQSSAAQVTTAYPVAAPPASGTAPEVAIPASNPAAPAAESSPAPANRIASVAAAKPESLKHSKPTAHALEEEDEGSDEADEAPAPAREVRPPRATADTGEATDEDSGNDTEAARPAPAHSASASASTNPNPAAGAHGRHRPYNIQIEAAMDRAGANAMLQRLHTLGYQSHLVPAQLNGQTWYKVVIGPYPSQEAAAAAQLQMRTKYNNTYGGGSAANAAAPKAGD